MCCLLASKHILDAIRCWYSLSRRSKLNEVVSGNTFSKSKYYAEWLNVKQNDRIPSKGTTCFSKHSLLSVSSYCGVMDYIPTPVSRMTELRERQLHAFDSSVWNLKQVCSHIALNLTRKMLLYPFWNSWSGSSTYQLVESTTLNGTGYNTRYAKKLICFACFVENKVRLAVSVVVFFFFNSKVCGEFHFKATKKRTKMAPSKILNQHNW